MNKVTLKLSDFKRQRPQWDLEVAACIVHMCMCGNGCSDAVLVGLQLEVVNYPHFHYPRVKIPCYPQVGVVTNLLLDAN